MLKNLFLFLISLLACTLLYGFEEGEGNLGQELVEELDSLLQTDVSHADSLVKKCDSCWNILEGQDLFEFSFTVGYLCTILDDSKCFDVLMSRYDFKNNPSPLEIIKLGVPLQFGDVLTQEERKRIIEFTRSANKEDKAIALYFLGVNALQVNNYTASEKLFKKLLQLSKKTKENFLICKTFQWLSKLEIERHDFKKGFEYLIKSLNYAKQNNLNYEKAHTDYLIGGLLLKMDNLTEAEAYFRKGLSIARSVRAYKLEADILLHLGIIQQLQENKQGAISNFSLALSKYYKLNYSKGIAQSHLRMGELYKKAASYKLSKENYLISKSYLEEINDSIQLGDAFYCLAEIEFNTSNYSAAKAYILKSIALREALNDPFLLYESVLLSAKIKEKLGEHQSALTDLMRYTTFTDSIENTALKAKIAELSELYQAEQKEYVILQQTQELEELTADNELRQQKMENVHLRNRQMIYLILCLIFGGFVLFIWLRFKRKQERSKQLQQEAELKQTVLRSQMNPHFIFNSMSVIQSYMYSMDTENSSIFIVNFSQLMRLILENSVKEFIPLSTELEILEKYLLIQKLRFDNQFGYKIDLGRLNVETISLPPMLTQPFIENAIEHGRLDTVPGGFIRILFEQEGDIIKIVVEDNGIGKDAPKRGQNEPSHKSMALKITKERIDLLNIKHKSTGSLDIIDLKSEGSTGTRVTIKTFYKNNN